MQVYVFWRAGTVRVRKKSYPRKIPVFSRLTHGGQIWPFNYVVGTRYPFLEGLHKIKNMKLIISRGAGTWGLLWPVPIRAAPPKLLRR